MDIELNDSYTFEEYLDAFYTFYASSETTKLNRTSERFNIIKGICEIDGHFSIDTLYEHLKKKKYQVSKATLYTTIRLLEQCDLIARHQFEENYAVFEKKRTDSHDHIVISATGEIINFSNKTIEKAISEIEKKYNVTVKQRSITLFCEQKKDDK